MNCPASSVSNVYRKHGLCAMADIGGKWRLSPHVALNTLSPIADKITPHHYVTQLPFNVNARRHKPMRCSFEKPNIFFNRRLKQFFHQLLTVFAPVRAPYHDKCNSSYLLPFYHIDCCSLCR